MRPLLLHHDQLATYGLLASQITHWLLDQTSEGAAYAANSHERSHLFLEAAARGTLGLRSQLVSLLVCRRRLWGD